MKTLSLVATLLISQTVNATVTRGVVKAIDNLAKGAVTAATPSSKLTRDQLAVGVHRARRALDSKVSRQTAEEILNITNNGSQAYGKSPQQISNLLASISMDKARALDGYKVVGINSRKEFILVKAIPARTAEHTVADGYTISYQEPGKIRIAVLKVFDTPRAENLEAVRGLTEAIALDSVNKFRNTFDALQVKITNTNQTAANQINLNAPKQSLSYETELTASNASVYQLSDLLFELLK